MLKRLKIDAIVILLFLPALFFAALVTFKLLDPKGAMKRSFPTSLPQTDISVLTEYRDKSANGILPCPAGTQQLGKVTPEGTALWCELLGIKVGPMALFKKGAQAYGIDAVDLTASYVDNALTGPWIKWSNGQRQDEGEFLGGKILWSKRGGNVARKVDIISTGIYAGMAFLFSCLIIFRRRQLQKHLESHDGISPAPTSPKILSVWIGLVVLFSVVMKYYPEHSMSIFMVSILSAVGYRFFKTRANKS